MVFSESNALWAIIFSFFLALLLSILPIPEWLQWGRPEWVAMVLIHWIIILPERVGITVAWVVGLLLDVLEGTALGQNAFALSVMAYVVLLLYQRVRMFTLWQQAGVVFVLVGLNQLIGNWVQTLQGSQSPNLLFLLPAFVSALLWPVVSVSLRALRQYFV